MCSALRFFVGASVGAASSFQLSSDLLKPNIQLYNVESLSYLRLFFQTKEQQNKQRDSGNAIRQKFGLKWSDNRFQIKAPIHGFVCVYKQTHLRILLQ